MYFGEYCSGINNENKHRYAHTLLGEHLLKWNSI